MLTPTSFMSLSSLRDFMFGIDLASVIAAEQRAQKSAAPANKDIDPADDLAEIHALLARFRADQQSAAQRPTSAVKPQVPDLEYAESRD